MFALWCVREVTRAIHSWIDSPCFDGSHQGKTFLCCTRRSESPMPFIFGLECNSGKVHTSAKVQCALRNWQEMASREIKPKTRQLSESGERTVKDGINRTGSTCSQQARLESRDERQGPSSDLGLQGWLTKWSPNVIQHVPTQYAHVTRYPNKRVPHK